MKSTEFNLVRYDADEGMVFDWKEPRYREDEDGNQVQEHLYAVTVFIGGNDTIDNYIEVPAPVPTPEPDEDEGTEEPEA